MIKKTILTLCILLIGIFGNVFCQPTTKELSKEEILSIAIKEAFPAEGLKHRVGYSMDDIEIIYEKDNALLDKLLKHYEYFPSVTTRPLQGIYFKPKDQKFNENLMVAVDKNTGEIAATIRVYKDDFLKRMELFKSFSVFSLILFFVLYLLIRTPLILGLTFMLIPISLGFITLPLSCPYGMDGIGTTIIIFLINFPSSIVSVFVPFHGYLFMFFLGTVQYFFVGLYIENFLRHLTNKSSGHSSGSNEPLPVR